MTALAFDLPPSLTHKRRGYTYSRVNAELFGAVLAIRQTNDVDAYAVDEFPPEGAARVFVIVRAGGELDDGIYCVKVSQEDYTAVCNCFGRGRWGNCKHSDALADVCRRQMEPPGPAASSPEPEPAPVHTEPYRDRDGMHRHRCPDCAIVWEHSDTSSVDDNAGRHLCPGCRAAWYWKYEGDEPPTTKGNP